MHMQKLHKLLLNSITVESLFPHSHSAFSCAVLSPLSWFLPIPEAHVFPLMSLCLSCVKWRNMCVCSFKAHEIATLFFETSFHSNLI